MVALTVKPLTIDSDEDCPHISKKENMAQPKAGDISDKAQQKLLLAKYSSTSQIEVIQSPTV